MTKRVFISLWLGCLLACSVEPSDSTGLEEDVQSSLGDIVSISGPGSEENPCDLPILVGPCNGAMPHFGYNQELNECLEFSYGGCNGNANRFLTLAECEDLCVSTEEEDAVADTTLEMDVEDADAIEDTEASDTASDAAEESLDALDTRERTAQDAVSIDVIERDVAIEAEQSDGEAEKDGDISDSN